MKQFVLCVTTNKCPAIGDAAQIICPYTGTTLSATGGGAGSCSLKTGTSCGVYSINRFPYTFFRTCSETNKHNAYIAYCGKNRDDMYAILLSQGSSSPKWKCRLPEFMTGGLHISPCGGYIIGAGKSGNCYCWSVLAGEGGELSRIWKAHYRSVTCVEFSDLGDFVVTGGNDGVVNVWSLMDIISEGDTLLGDVRKNSTSLDPFKTWSEHQLGITSLYSMQSSRIISTSSDRQIVIMEVFSGKTLGRILMPSSILSLTADSVCHRLFAGGHDGTIYCVDLDAYAIATTAEFAKTIDSSNDRRKKARTDIMPSLSGSKLEETILGKDKAQHLDTNSYISELHGHDRAVSCLNILESGEGLNDILVSGSNDGSVRIWDLNARCCMRILNPWSITSPSISENKPSQNACSPCSSIIALTRDSVEGCVTRKADTLFSISSSSRAKKDDPSMNLIKPLQRFVKSQKEKNTMNHTNAVVPAIESVRHISSVKGWENFEDYNLQ